MAVKTQLTEEDFTDILRNYDLGELRRFEPVTKGNVQTTYVLQTTGGQYMFRYYENRPLESVLFESELLEFLNNHHYPCPAIFRRQGGEFVGVYWDKPCMLFEFVEGEHIENPSDEQRSQLIEQVAHLHSLTRDFLPPYTPYRWNYSPSLCLELAQDTAQKLNTPNAKAKLEWFKGELSRISLPAALPKGICHCDFHFSNILFQDGQFKALLDFDDANYTYLTFDLATLINPFIADFEWHSWQNFHPEDAIFDFTDARKIVSEYIKHRELSSEELTHLFDVFKLSIMLDCIWYFERGDVSDFYEKRKIDALNRLGREGFTRALV